MAMRPPVIVGYNPDFAPFTLQQDGQPTGLVVRRLQRAFHNAGLSPELTAVDMPNMQDALETGRIAAIAALGVTPERQHSLAFSQPLAISGGAWFIQRDGRWLPDRELASAPSGTCRVITPASGPLARLIAEQFPTLQLHTCADYSTALQSVANGEADAAALNWQVGVTLCETDYPDLVAASNSPFWRLPLALATTAGDPLGILALINPHIPGSWAN